jgi:membrane protease YdiL (CAAX protease family)
MKSAMHNPSLHETALVVLRTEFVRVALLPALAALGVAKFSYSSAVFIVSMISFVLGRGAPTGGSESLVGWVEIAVLALIALAARKPVLRRIRFARTVVVCVLFATLSAIATPVLFVATFCIFSVSTAYTTPNVLGVVPLAATFYAILSEWVFRGALIDAIRAGGGSDKLCVITSALAWGLTGARFDHGLIQAVLQCLFGLVLGATRIHTGRLAYAMAIHVGYNVSLIGFSVLR